MRLLVFSVLVPMVTSLPTLLVNSGRSRCVNVEAPQDTVIRVVYDAPDIETDKQAAGYAPTFLSVNVRPATRVMDTKLHSAPILQRLKPTNKMLEEKQGTLEHTFEVDGSAAVCIRASGASANRPMRFGLRVVQASTDPVKAVAGSGTNLDGQLSHMEVEMKRIETGMHGILREADFSKERDAVFHQQTQSMHAATVFWPIVQCCILLMTGFTQARHIVHFFRSRRII